MKKAQSVIENNDGSLLIDICASEVNADWMKAGRLKALADAGDKEAAEKLARMEATQLYYEE